MNQVMMMKNYFLSILLLLAFSAIGQKKHYLLVGTYTGGKSKGIYVYNFNPADGSAVIVDSVAISNPSFLDIAPDKKTVYTVNENGTKGNGGGITSFSFDGSTGHMTQLSSSPSMGDHPCYISADKTGKWLMVGNYSSGTAALYSVDKKGNFSVQRTINFNESKENVEKKKPARVHATVFSKDNRFVFIPDLGSDKIWVYKFDAAKGNLSSDSPGFVRFTDSSGPRHFTFHPTDKWAYLVQEFTGSVTAFKYSNGKLQQIQTISGLPMTYKGPARSADIHVSPDGKFLYSSNRDPSNNIAIFRINQKTGQLSLVGHQPVLGRTPRNFNFDPTGHFMLVANQNSDQIVVFAIDHTTGLLKDTGKRIDVGNPVCVKWIVK